MLKKHVQTLTHCPVRRMIVLPAKTRRYGVRAISRIDDVHAAHFSSLGQSERTDAEHQPSSLFSLKPLTAKNKSLKIQDLIISKLINNNILRRKNYFLYLTKVSNGNADI